MKKSVNYKNYVIGIGAIIIIVVLWVTGFYHINKRMDRSDYRGFMEDCIEHIENDTQFKEDYGTPINFIEHENKKIQKQKDGDSVIGLLVSFYVEVDSGKFYQVTMRTYKEADEWKIDYHEVKETKREDIVN
ncbi:MAG: hypothetical protein J6M35_02815 [Clostridia bacterium]|nr:hypothetical protein [Clostridia bacterium]